ncbi:MAG: tetratricopeptide repeat protein [Acidobacteria bacterium]|nr:tetratricopeptide repeat protein [Acidobacteriota bacterium]
MKAKAGDDDRSSKAAPLLKTLGLALALGVAAWFAGPLLFPVKPPADFPKLPDLQKANPDLRALLQRADEEARRKPGSAEAVGKLGMAYHSNLLYEQAKSAYRIAARLAPGDHQWAYAQSVLQEENANEREQVPLLHQTVRLKSDHVLALIKLADWLFKQDRLGEAAQYYERAAKVPDGGAELQASFALGRVAARRREWSKVVEHISPLTRAYPHAAPLYELLREAHESLGQSDKAAEARQRMALAKWKAVPPLEDPFNEHLIGLSYSSTRLLKHAGLLSRMGQADRAIEVGRRAAQADPTDADVRNFLARTLLTFYGDKPDAVDEALTQLDECLRLRPEDPVPLGGVADDFFKSPKPPAAVARLRAMLRSRAKLPGVHFFLGQAAQELGETEEAVTQYTAALKETPRNSAIYNKLGLIAESAGRDGEAIAHFQKAVQLNPLNASARLNLAIELVQRGNYVQGLKELDELLRINPHDAAAHFCMAFALLTIRRTDEAISKFRQGLLYKPDDAEAHFGLGSALAAQGKMQDASTELREALRLRPDHRRARDLLDQLER